MISSKNLESKLIKYQDDLVLLDRDVAQLYDVETRGINQAVSNNPDKFPSGYLIEISKEEKNELVKNSDRFNTLKHSTVNPKFEFNLGFAKVSRSIKKIKKES